MKRLLKLINYELYHVEGNVFKLKTNYIRKGKDNIDIEIIKTNDEFTYSKADIPNYLFNKVESYITNYLKPFKKGNVVCYKDKEYTIVDVNGLMKIDNEWYEVISYLPKYGKIIHHRKVDDFVSKFKLINH